MHFCRCSSFALQHFCDNGVIGEVFRDDYIPDAQTSSEAPGESGADQKFRLCRMQQDFDVSAAARSSDASVKNGNGAAANFAKKNPGSFRADDSFGLQLAEEPGTLGR